MLILGQKFLIGKILYKFYIGWDPDPDPDLANLKTRIRIRIQTKVVRIRNTVLSSELVLFLSNSSYFHLNIILTVSKPELLLQLIVSRDWGGRLMVLKDRYNVY
jgi:hypothetical protein